MSEARTVSRRRWALALLLSWVSLAALAPAASAVPDYDGDGRVEDDCAPLDPDAFPGAPDRPDLSFEDTNCDGLDGDAADAVFVAVNGSDAGTGARDSPLRAIKDGVTLAAAQGKDVYVGTGTYNEQVAVVSNVGIYGGYDPFTVGRGGTTINGAPEAILANGDQNVVLQLLALTGNVDTARNAYAVRAINGAELALVSVTATAANAAAGTNGATGPPGGNGGRGNDGLDGGCAAGAGGSGGAGANAGGSGGRGGFNSGSGISGSAGGPSGTGGAGGSGGTVDSLSGVGGTGLAGTNGVPGGAGAIGSQGAFSTGSAAAVWVAGVGANGGAGASGSGGRGGGGGGGGGGGDGIDLAGGGGGGAGGGGGGFPGGGGGGGQPGGGSFAAYVFNSSLVAEASTLSAGNGGSGGNGGGRGFGGNGGTGGTGGSAPGCGDATPGAGGPGGTGGRGGNGGLGGGGAGGPSAGIFRAGTSSFAVRSNSTVQAGAGGPGGRLGGTGAPAADGEAAPLLPAGSQSSTTSDFDADGIPDLSDACPDVPRGATDVNGDGCPDRRPRLIDTDGDTVPDGFDTCPTTAGNPTDGCPDASPQPAPAQLPAPQLPAQQPPPPRDPFPADVPTAETIDALPNPEPFREINIENQTGVIFVRLPGGRGGAARTSQSAPTGFIPLTQAAQVPVGTIVEAARGRIELEAALDRRGLQTQTADFYSGRFEIRQRPARLPVTEMVLKGGSFRGCPRTSKSDAGTAQRRRRVRRLWGDGRGRFRTRGRYSAATVRGTKWLVEDRCDGTLTRVARRPRTSRVVVSDFVRRRSVTLRAGRSYLAAPR